jgi:hypothetical protein
MFGNRGFLYYMTCVAKNNYAFVKRKDDIRIHVNEMCKKYSELLRLSTVTRISQRVFFPLF